MIENRKPAANGGAVVGSPTRGERLAAYRTPYRWRGQSAWDPELVRPDTKPCECGAEMPRNRRSPLCTACTPARRRAPRTPEQTAAEAAKRRAYRASITPEERAAKRRDADARYRAKRAAKEIAA